MTDKDDIKVFFRYGIASLATSVVFLTAVAATRAVGATPPSSLVSAIAAIIMAVFAFHDRIFGKLQSINTEDPEFSPDVVREPVNVGGKIFDSKKEAAEYITSERSVEWYPGGEKWSYHIGNIIGNLLQRYVYDKQTRERLLGVSETVMFSLTVVIGLLLMSRFLYDFQSNSILDLPESLRSIFEIAVFIGQIQLPRYIVIFALLTVFICSGYFLTRDMTTCSNCDEPHSLVSRGRWYQQSGMDSKPIKDSERTYNTYQGRRILECNVCDDVKIPATYWDDRMILDDIFS